MNGVILYGSHYGSARRYAQALAESTGIVAVPYANAPQLAGKHTIVYVGALYAGGVLGLRKTFRGFSPQEGQTILIVTVGLADPNDPENRANIRTALQRQLSAEVLQRAKLFHLRGGIDYSKLSLGHRAAMALVYRAARRAPEEKQTAENRALIETYGQRVNFEDLRALEPVLQAIPR